MKPKKPPKPSSIKISTTKKAILARAFRDELGTNDPAEERVGEVIKALFVGYKFFVAH